MSRFFARSLTLAVLAACSALALADPPAVVGRISSVQGQVTILGEGDPNTAILNWPVTSANHVTTTRGARTEFRVGSTAVRVDGDSDLQVDELDEDVMRLRLNYGSVSIRVRNPDLLRDFELLTPQARITMLEPGLLRVDAERIADTTQVSVLSGSARAEGAGSSLVLNGGRRADIGAEDVRTALAGRDSFDDWGDGRDRSADAGIATRYIPTDITGYEELNQSGTWQDSVEYGVLWTPRGVAADWAPYRDGRWTWLAPWGWTWVDNAPWGYAPSHYGRWVRVGPRWCWAPGRLVGRPVWSPALVGWVGGDQLHNAGHHRAPGLGWFPLSPRERYVPPYRVSVDHERRLGWSRNGKAVERSEERHERHEGVTILPREQFDMRRTVQVSKVPRTIPAPAEIGNLTVVAPPTPAGRPYVENHRRDAPDRADRAGWPERRGRDEGRQWSPPVAPARVISTTQPALPAQPAPTQAPWQLQQQTNAVQLNPATSAPAARPADGHHDGRPSYPGQPQPSSSAEDRHNGRNERTYHPGEDGRRTGRDADPLVRATPAQPVPQPQAQPAFAPQPVQSRPAPQFQPVQAPVQQPTQARPMPPPSQPQSQPREAPKPNGEAPKREKDKDDRHDRGR